MDEGLPIIENPSLVTVASNRFVAVTWDGRDVVLTFGRAAKLPKRMGVKAWEEKAVVYPNSAVAMPLETAAEAVQNLLALIQSIRSEGSTTKTKN